MRGRLLLSHEGSWRRGQDHLPGGAAALLVRLERAVIQGYLLLVFKFCLDLPTLHCTPLPSPSQESDSEPHGRGDVHLQRPWPDPLGPPY